MFHVQGYIRIYSLKFYLFKVQVVFPFKFFIKRYLRETQERKVPVFFSVYIEKAHCSIEGKLKSTNEEIREFKVLC